MHSADPSPGCDSGRCAGYVEAFCSLHPGETWPFNVLGLPPEHNDRRVQSHLPRSQARMPTTSFGGRYGLPILLRQPGRSSQAAYRRCKACSQTRDCFLDMHKPQGLLRTKVTSVGNLSVFRGSATGREITLASLQQKNFKVQRSAKSASFQRTGKEAGEKDTAGLVLPSAKGGSPARPKMFRNDCSLHLSLCCVFCAGSITTCRKSMDLDGRKHFAW